MDMIKITDILNEKYSEKNTLRWHGHVIKKTIKELRVKKGKDRKAGHKEDGKKVLNLI